jgi:hypothetical protein
MTRDCPPVRGSRAAAGGNLNGIDNRDLVNPWQRFASRACLAAVHLAAGSRGQHGGRRNPCLTGPWFCYNQKDATDRHLPAINGST